MKKLMSFAAAAALATASAVAAQTDASILVKRLAASNVDQSVSAFNQLTAMGSPAIPALIDGLASHDELIRTQSALVLAKVGGPAVPALVDALDAFEWRTRAWAAKALGEMDHFDARAVQPLIDAALSDEHWWVQSEAALALANTTDARAVVALERIAAEEDERVRMRALHALAIIRDNGGAGF